ncbi:MAG: DEAD/DEAH box helicase family protein [Acetobacter sp.]|nr:DEAD/DEAH box helicase family protein [Acetobacter sp.]
MPPTTANTSAPNSLTRPQKGMHFQFDANQPHQIRALESVISVFEGQDLNKTTFSMPSLRCTLGGLEEHWTSGTSDLGIGNRLRLCEEELLANVQKIQSKNALKPSRTLPTRDFTLEMETGTGKTYVYLRSLFEMHKHYGFTKFVIVVPSLAIKEGVLKFLDMTKTHFKEYYDNTPYEYFVYDSNKLTQIRNFAVSDHLHIMVINIDAFRKSFKDPTKESSANIIHRYNDSMQGTPIEFIRATNPIVIIDEPQSVDTTENSAKAIASLNPLCTFRYSATHTNKHTMLYKLDSVDAYNQELVKQIEVASLKVEDSHNKAYIKLLSVDNTKSPITAKIEIDVQQKDNVKRKTVTVKQGTDLFEASKGRALYEGYIIRDIFCGKGNEYIDFTSQEDVLRLGETIGSINNDDYKRLQIRKTIEEHLEKELRLTPRGIKVLSLFFIDRVANYRDYTAPDQKGKYAHIFEEEYTKAIKKPKYASLFQEVDTTTLAQEVHNGYFSEDKKTGRSKDTTGVTKDDEDTYALIMRDKEKLLSFDSKLKFIFSHSALKEGWDNPNVFQICTLNETSSILKKRQEIGRGLRLCVNQQGERIKGFDVNTLTVMTNDSYENFVKDLQKEIEDEEGIKFGLVEPHIFTNIPVQNADGTTEPLGLDQSEALYQHLVEKAYITPSGKILDALKKDLKENTLDLPPVFEPLKPDISACLKKIAGGLNIKNNDNKRTIKINKAVFESPEFRELWDKIKFKTRYNVEFDPSVLMHSCLEALRNIVIGKTKFVYGTAKIKIEQSGLTPEEEKKTSHTYEARDYLLPDVITYLQDETNLKRQTIVDILRRSGKLESFKNNPQQFLKEALIMSRVAMQKCLVDGIKYHKIGDHMVYTQELFENEELIGYFDKNMQEAKKSVYDHVVYDSESVEAQIASDFEKDERIKVYAKLPHWFKIDTPLGSYNPDWAVLFEEDGQERLYLVVETKESDNLDSLRLEARNKITCGEKHFEALETGADYKVTNSFKRLLEKLEDK